MTRAVQIRLSIFGTVGVLALTAWAYTAVVDRAIDTRLNDELIFAYDHHLSTVRELVKYAHDHRIDTANDLKRALAEDLRPPSPRDHKNFAGFEHKHRSLRTAARELVTTLDGELDPDDSRLAHLIRRFDSEERALSKIRERFNQAGLGWSLGALGP